MTLDLGRLGTVIQKGAGVAMAGPSIDGALQTLRIAGGITAMGTVAMPVTDPESVMSVTSAMVTATLGTGTLRGFDQAGPLLPDTLPISGMARFCFLAG